MDRLPVSDLWCGRCPREATHDRFITRDEGKTIERVSRCDDCAWALVNAPKGRTR